MLSLTRVSSGQAGTYYTADDYYLQDSGQWHGELAMTMGFAGTIKEEDFQSLIMGVDPKGRFEIESGGKENIHTAGVDLTFSAPKSVSIAGLVLDDLRVIDAHNKAVSETLDYIEKNYTNVRIHEGGTVHSEHTGNMLAAKFQHISSRELDPQLHTHALVMNFTAKENLDIKAMDYGEIYDAKMLLGQIYRSELAANLKELGYTIEADSKGLFEIKGVPAELMSEFSKRSEQIQARFEELKDQFPNATDAKLKEMATLDTRKSKDEPNMVELKSQWDKSVSDLNLDKKQIQNSMVTGEVTDKSNQVSTDIDVLIEKAVHVATEQEAVASRDDILKTATKLSVGEFRVGELQNALEQSQSVIKLDDKSYTTFAIVEMERKIVDQVEAGKDSMPVMTEVEINRGIQDYQSAKGFNLTEGQRDAVVHVLNSPDRIIAIQGDAGTGKTTMLDVVRSIGEKNQQEIVGLSFTGKAASEIEDASQIPSRTIASLVGGQDDLRGKLVVIDEASMLSIKDLNSVLAKSDEKTKIVLIGDTKQLQTLGQGKIFGSLQEKDIISTVRMSEVQRQQDPDYKGVVDQLGARQVAEAFARLDAKDKINEVVDRGTRLSNITRDYLANPKDTIIVTATNKDREDLNQMIRHELKQNGIVQTEGVEYTTRESKSLIGDGKFFAENYSVGDILVANKAGVFGKAGAEARIVEVDPQNNQIKVVTAENKSQLYLDVQQQGSNLQIYSETKKHFADGDKILFLKNDKGLGVKNGQTGSIVGIEENGALRVKTEKGHELKFNPSTQYRYIGHGYALTDYKSQGQTAKHVIYHADTSKGVNFNQAYVGITRGKKSVTIYTDNKTSLMEKVKHDQVKSSTLNYDLSQAKSNNHERLTKISERIPTIKNPDSVMNKIGDKADEKTNEPKQQKERGKGFER